MAITQYKFDLEKANSFLDFCCGLYRHDANWIPPLRNRALAQFSPDFPFYRQAGNDHQHFLATAAGMNVGHVSAMVNARLKDQDGEPVGLVGFFECVEELSVATELLGHASHWLRTQHGVRRIWGPMQFDIPRADFACLPDGRGCHPENSLHRHPSADRETAATT